MSTLDDWLADAAAALDLPADSISTELRDGLLDLTREVAHGVTRVAGPLTTYLLGLAVGAGADPASAVRTLSGLAAQQSAPQHSAAEPAAESNGGAA